MARPLTTQVFKSTSLRPCNFLSQKVRGREAWRNSGQAGLYASSGERKYLNSDERRKLLAKFETLDPDKCLFALMLAWTGARVSEVLALTANSFQVDASIVTIETLKQRGYCVREISDTTRLDASHRTILWPARIAARPEWVETPLGVLPPDPVAFCKAGLRICADYRKASLAARLTPCLRCSRDAASSTHAASAALDGPCAAFDNRYLYEHLRSGRTRIRRTVLA